MMMNRSDNPSSDSELLFVKGRYHYWRSELQRAFLAFKHSAQMDTDNLHSLFGLAVLQILLGPPRYRPASSVEILERLEGANYGRTNRFFGDSTASGQQAGWVQSLLGFAYYEVYDYTKAIDWAEKAAAQNPDNKWFVTQAALIKSEYAAVQAALSSVTHRADTITVNLLPHLVISHARIRYYSERQMLGEDGAKAGSPFAGELESAFSLFMLGLSNERIGVEEQAIACYQEYIDFLEQHDSLSDKWSSSPWTSYAAFRIKQAKSSPPGIVRETKGWIHRLLTPKEFEEVLEGKNRQIVWSKRSSSPDALTGLQSENQLWFFRSPSYTWRGLYGRAGVCVVNDGIVTFVRVTMMN